MAVTVSPTAAFPGSEIPEGYKASDVGAIPEEWDVAPLSQLLELRNGVNADKSAYGSGIRFINVLEVITKSHLRGRDAPGRVTLSDATTKAYAVRRGDVLFNRTSETQEEVGLAAVYEDDEPVVFGGFVIRGRPTTSRLDAEYLGYGLRSAAVRQQIIKRGQGAIRANVGQADLRQVLVPVPPVGEQRAVAAALKDADELLLAIDRLIEKKRAMKQGSMQQLLAGEIRLHGHDGEWVERRLGDVLRVRHGRSQKEVVVEEGKYPILASGGEIGRTNTPLYEKPSVLIGRKGTIDRPRYQETPFWTVDTLFYTELGPAVEAAFLYYQFLRVDWRSYNEASGVPSLNASTIENITLRFPSKDEQRAIAAVLLDLDGEIEVLESRRAKIHALKLGMLQELLSGRTRLRGEGV